MSFVSQRIFRANPRYELVMADRLSAAERRALGDPDDEDLYGILRPLGDCGLETRSCSPDTALLVLSLAEPAPLPAFARRSLGEDGERVLARLIADGVLEMSTDDGFRSGPATADLVLSVGSSAGQGRIAQLSAAALRYGQALTFLSAEMLASRLYCYGRQPISPELRCRMPDARAVDEHVGIVSDGRATFRTLHAGWVQKPHDGRPLPWRHWVPSAARRETASPGRAGPLYKLYVSPSFDAMSAAVAAVAGSLAVLPGVKGFKIACDLAGICRSDKIVAYFDRLDDLQEGASRIAAQIDGIPAHGVPFTAAITLDGLLSWGADPPLDPAAPRSWRMWVTERLAEYLVMASGREGGNHQRAVENRTGHDVSADRDGIERLQIEPWQFALARLQLAGVDTNTWVPSSGMWRDADEPAANHRSGVRTSPKRRGGMPG